MNHDDRHTLQKAFYFKKADLEANRNGVLTHSQRELLTGEMQISMFVIAFILMMMSCTLVMESATEDTAGRFGLLMALVFGVLAIWMVMTSARAMETNPKRKGRQVEALPFEDFELVEVISKKADLIPTYVVMIGDRQFSMSETAYNALHSADVKTIYVLIGSDRILSAE